MTVAELNNHFNQYFAIITIRDKKKNKDFKYWAQNGKFITESETNNLLSKYWDREVTDWEYGYDDNHIYIIVD